jgi:hypothetical protein
MKQNVFSRLAGLALALGFFTIHSAFAQTAEDDAAQAVYTNGWFNGTNGGSGFGPWVLTNTVNDADDFSGFLILGSGVAAVDTNGKSFAMYANGDNTDAALAYRSISNALTVGQVFTLKFANGSVANNGDIGFCLGNSATFPPALSSLTFVTLATSASFMFYFTGGSSDYYVYDGNGTSDSGVPWTEAGLTLQFALVDSGHYSLTIKSADGSTTLASFFDQPLTGSANLDTFAGFNLQTGSGENDYFNQFSILPVTHLPPSIQNVQPANNSAYLPTSTNITFNAVENPLSGIGINTNGIVVTLNGTNVTNLSFTGSATNWSVVATPVLVPNAIYDGVITVTDTNGNEVESTFTFNTWSATDMYVQASDYNYTGGHYIASPTIFSYSSQYDVAATSNIDYYLSSPNPTNSTGYANNYRPLDPIWMEPSGDTLDHAYFFEYSSQVTNWSMGFMEPNEWENYTRLVTNGAYNVYLRASAAPDVLMEVDASSTATSTNQPRAALGTFAGVDTFDILSNYTFVPLKDFFSSNVVVRFSTNKPTTNTFRLTNIGGNGSYNWDYLIFVPLSVANTNTQRPYISAGYPYPGAGNVLPVQPISFTIVNRDTTVATASIQLFVNGANVSSSLVLSNNSAGTVVTYTPSTLYELNTNSTVTAIFADTAGIYQTNTWQFNVANVLIIPPSYALAPGSAVSNGFAMHVVKYPDAWPSGYSPAPESSNWAAAILAGAILNTNVTPNQAGTPSTNVYYVETNTLNYEDCGTNQPSGFYTFTGERAFPYISTTPYSDCNDITNNDQPDDFAIGATFYVQLSAGFYQWAIRSDDAAYLTTGTGSTPDQTVVMYDSSGGTGHSAQYPNVFNFIIETTGVYPMQLLYYQGGFGASLELYSQNPITGAPIALLNDPTNPNTIPVYQTSTSSPSLVILDPRHTGSTTTFNFLTELGKTHTVQYTTSLTNTTWQTLQVVAGNGSVTNITDATATNAIRYYRVSTQ